ncbi:hypothetical protein L6164_018132 [Bauhinia variegata]|uniref:Uncharacterized protein n=1 Tax=Bauhinia variegata TaxID=167791 RepID=A0ACB9NBK5_BAUVA|nr:hypothetical protein L6164_018132 [Bauhinia variegata]
MYEYIIVSNEDEESFSYTSQNEKSQWVLFHNGQLMDTRGSDIARTDTCYGYNTEGGCQRWEQPECRHPGDTFSIRFGYFDHPSLPGDFAVTDHNTSLTASDCKATCWTNCTCVGFTTSFPNGTGCRYYYGIWEPAHLIAADLSVYILEQQHSDHKDRKNWIRTSALIISLIVVVGLIMICLAIFYLRLRRRRTAFEDQKISRMDDEILDLVASDRHATVNELRNEVKKGNDSRVFSYASVMEATNRFSPGNKLGEGGFGPVYKVIIT